MIAPDQKSAGEDDSGPDVHILYDENGIMEQVLINQQVDMDGDSEMDKFEKSEYEVNTKNSKFNCFITNLKKLVNTKTSTELLEVKTNKVTNDPSLPEPKILKSEEFQYKLKTRGKNDLESFVKLATNDFLCLNELRGRLSYVYDYMVETIPTPENWSNFESNHPLSTINAWIWMSAEIIQLYESSTDVLQDPTSIIKCKEFISQQLLSISNQLKELMKCMMNFTELYNKFQAKFDKIHSMIRKKFTEAISVEIEELRSRFLQESKDRSSELISILSRRSPIPKGSEEYENEFVCWGIDGLSLKANKKFILLNVTKNKSTNFIIALNQFFGGFENFLKRSGWFIKGCSITLSKIYKHKDDKPDFLTNLLTVCNNMGYVYPMEQSRCIQSVWQIEQVIRESLDLAEKITHGLEISCKISKIAFGKQTCLATPNNFNLSFQPFLLWKLCRGLCFQLNLVKTDLPRKSGALSLMVPNKCSNNTPLFFQIFENNFCALIDFEEEYKHRKERLRQTENVLEEDVRICCDVVQLVHHSCRIITEKVRKMSDTFDAVNYKLTQNIQTDSGLKEFPALNIWLFICTESLLAINSSNITVEEKNNIISDFENCFHIVEQLMSLCKTAWGKYQQQLRDVQKLRGLFSDMYPDSRIYFLEEINGLLKRNDNSQTSLAITIPEPNKNFTVSATLAYNGLYIDNIGQAQCYTLGTLKSPHFFQIIKLFLDHTKEILSSATDIYSESVEFINSFKSSELRNDGRKGIKTVIGIHGMIQEIFEELQKDINMNSLEILVVHLSLKDLYCEIVELIASLQSIISIRPTLNKNFKYPLLVLNTKMGKGWRTPEINIFSVADYICGTILFPLYEKPLVGELKHILANVGDSNNEYILPQYVDKKEELSPVTVVPEPEPTEQISYLINLIMEFDRIIFWRLNCLRLALHKPIAVSVPTPLFTPLSRFTQESTTDKYSNIIKPYFVSTLAILTAIAVQQSQRLSKVQSIKEVEKLVKSFQKLVKKISCFLETLTKLNGRLIKSGSLIFPSTANNVGVHDYPNKSHDPRPAINDESFENLSTFDRSTSEDLILSFELGSELSRSPLGLLSFNYVGYERKLEFLTLPVIAKFNLIRIVITSLGINLHRQKKNIRKLGDQKKVFNSLNKLIPFFPSESLNIQKLRMSLDIAKISLERVEGELQKTKAALALCLDFFKEKAELAPDDKKLLSLQGLVEELRISSVEILISGKM